MRAPHLHDTLRRFCLGAFAVFTRDLEDGTDLPFAFEEHGSYGRPTLYEYRPLVRGFVEARACCRGTSDASLTGSACSSSSARSRAERQRRPTPRASLPTR